VHLGVISLSVNSTVTLKTSHYNRHTIQELECLGLEWNSHGATWEDWFSELAHYHEIHGHCNIIRNNSENTKLAYWVTTCRIQALEILSVDWQRSISRGKGTPKKSSPDDDATREAPEQMQTTTQTRED
jgi:hypothetical protein